MHDPCTLAFDIYLGPKEKKNGHYRTPLITIWHKDPEKDGTDDSCGWFLRSRHIDPKLFDIVKREFEFNFQHDYWFNSGGYPQFSTLGVVLNMYSTAAWKVFMFNNGNKPSDKARSQWRAFMRKHLFDILLFAENPTDSLHNSVHMKYGVEEKSYRVSNFTRIILADIMRKLRPWYKHPRWHVHHWQITFPLFRDLYRRYFERCSVCKNKFGTSSVYSDWGGGNKRCEKCEGVRNVRS